MTHQKSPRQDHVEAQRESTNEASREKVAHPARTESLDRLAALIATGEIPLPAAIGSGDKSRLLAKAGRQRRDRLIRFIARAIALDIHRSAQNQTQGDSIAQTNLQPTISLLCGHLPADEQRSAKSTQS